MTGKWSPRNWSINDPEQLHQDLELIGNLRGLSGNHPLEHPAEAAWKLISCLPVRRDPQFGRAQLNGLREITLHSLDYFPRQVMGSKSQLIGLPIWLHGAVSSYENQDNQPYSLKMPPILAQTVAHEVSWRSLVLGEAARHIPSSTQEIKQHTGVTEMLRLLREELEENTEEWSHNHMRRYHDLEISHKQVILHLRQYRDETLSKLTMHIALKLLGLRQTWKPPEEEGNILHDLLMSRKNAGEIRDQALIKEMIMISLAASNDPIRRANILLQQVDPESCPTNLIEATNSCAIQILSCLPTLKDDAVVQAASRLHRPYLNHIAHIKQTLPEHINELYSPVLTTSPVEMCATIKALAESGRSEEIIHCWSTLKPKDRQRNARARQMDRTALGLAIDLANQKELA